MTDHLACDMQSRLGALGPAEIESLIAAAAAEGALKPDRRGFRIIPPGSSETFAGLPLVVKPFSADPRGCNKIAIMLSLLRQTPRLPIAPHWAGTRHILCPFYEDWVDLRNCLETRQHSAAIVHRHCTNFLNAFAEEVPRLKWFLTRHGLGKPNPFPLLQRYQVAAGIISRFLGENAAAAIAQAAPALSQEVSWQPFSDAKPANFLIPPPVLSVEAGCEPVKIDLDMLIYDVPQALEYIIALFSMPMAGFDDGDSRSGFIARLDVLTRAVSHLGLGSEDMARLLWYHFLRNFTSALRSSNFEKAEAMGRCLLEAPPLFPCLNVGTPFIVALSLKMKSLAERKEWREGESAIRSDLTR